MKEVPFHHNPDGMSCGQCCYKMALEYFFPEHDWSFKKMDELCGAVKGKYTWPYKPIIELEKIGCDLVGYSNFDVERFVDNPKKYLVEEYSEEFAQDQFANSDMPTVLEQAKAYIRLVKDRKIDAHKSSYSISNVRDLLDNGYLVCMWVNSKALNGESGVTGHFILVHSYTEDSVIANDPGGINGGIKNRHIKHDDLMKAVCPITQDKTQGVLAIKRSAK